MLVDIEKLASIVVDAVDKPLAPFIKRIEELEQIKEMLDDNNRWAMDSINADFERIGKRIDELDARAAVSGPEGKEGPPGKDGRDGVDGKDGAPGAAGIHGKDGRDGVDGKDGAAGLNGKDGADGINGKDGRDGVDGKDGADGLNGKDGSDGLNGKDGADGINGKDADPVEIAKILEPALERVIEDRVAKAIAALELKDGQDGLGITDAVVNLDGRLILTFSNGTTKDVGRIVGKDGRDGLPGGPPGPPGPQGERGQDGLSIEDKGVYRPGIYQKGNAVSYGGSLFIAQEETDEKPEAGPSWRLAVKRGRDGKDGEKGPKGDPGAPGKPGRDLLPN